jgi:hypothetical protein
MTTPAVASARVDVPLDQADAFDTFTTEIGDWFVINQFTVRDHTEIRTVRIEPGVGGRLVYVKSIETGDGVTAGRVIAWDPPRLFAFVDGRELEVTVTFEPLGVGCRVTVEERGFDKLDPDVARRVQRHSWHQHLPTWFEEHVHRRSTTR